MRSFSTTDIEQYYYDMSNGIGAPVFIRIEYKDDNSVWEPLENVSSGTYSVDRDNDRPNLYSLIPPVDTLDFTIDNGDRKYYSGGIFDGIIVPNRDIRFYLGIILPEYLYSDTTKVYDLSDGFGVGCALSGGSIVVNTDSLDLRQSSPFYSTDTMYDAGIYDTSVYGTPHYLTKPIKIPRYTNQSAYISKVSFTSAFAGGDVYLRYFIGGRWTAWTDVHDTTIGANEITLDSTKRYEYIQLCITQNTSEDIDFTPSFTLTYSKEYDDFLLGEFYIYNPQFNTDEDIISVKCGNITKQILDAVPTTDEYTSPTLYSTYIEDLLDKVGIDSSNYDITPTTGYYIRSGLAIFNSDTARDVLEKAIEALQVSYIEAGGDVLQWRLYTKDTLLTLNYIPNTTDINFVFSSNHFDFGLNEDVDYEDQLSHITIYSDENSIYTDGEAILHNATNYTQADISGGFITIPFDNPVLSTLDALVKIRPIISTTGDYIITEVERDLERNYSGGTYGHIKFAVSGSSGTIDIVVKGAAINTLTGFVGESAGDGSIQRSGKGKYISVVNPFIKSYEEAKALAELLYSYYSSNKRNVQGEIQVDPRVQINDIVLIKRNDYVYVIKGYSINFGENYSVSMSVALEDNGETITVLYDSDDDYDSNLAYDYDIYTSLVDINTYAQPNIAS